MRNADTGSHGRVLNVGPSPVYASDIDGLRARQSADRQAAIASRKAAIADKANRKARRNVKRWAPEDAALVSSLLNMDPSF